jgi:hypothetical protein
MTTHQATVPPVAAEYFERYREPGNAPEHPVITYEFRARWVHTGYRKRISGAWLRKLRRQGVTDVTLTAHNRHADFRVAELLRRAR